MVVGMWAKNIPAAILLLLFSIDVLHANRRKQKETKVLEKTNICEIGDHNPKVHCYCDNPERNEAIKSECWIFNEQINETDPFWETFTSQNNIEVLAFNVRAEGELNFVPTKVLNYMKKLKIFSIKSSSILQIHSETFLNLTSVQEMTLTKNNIAILNKYAFYNLPNLTKLTLNDNKIVKLETDTFYGLPTLQKLFLSNNNISTIEEGAFQQLFNLLELKLDRNNLSDLKNESFNGLAYLTRLDLRRNKLTALSSFTFVELWNLEELWLDYNEISVLATRTFDGLSQLKRLSLSHNKLVTVVDRLLEGIRGVSALDLSYNMLKKFTMDDVHPIYDNLKLQNSYINLEGNDFECDCHLAWMYELRHETNSIKVRTSLENFICKLNKDNIIFQQGYFEQVDEKENDQFEEIDEMFIAEPKKVRGDNDRTLLQIPVEMLPCAPVEVKTVTVKPYTHPSQIEAKDYRNHIKSGSLIASGNILIYYITIIILLLNFTI